MLQQGGTKKLVYVFIEVMLQIILKVSQIFCFGIRQVYLFQEGFPKSSLRIYLEQRVCEGNVKDDFSQSSQSKAA
jgi:hypothetical protein